MGKDGQGTVARFFCYQPWKSGCLLDGAVAGKHGYGQGCAMLAALLLDFMYLCHAPRPSPGFSQVSW